MKLAEMERTALIDLFITKISGNEKETEIAHILASFAAVKLSLSSASKYNVTEYDTDELIDLIETGVLNTEKGGYEEEETAWNIILDSLEPDKVYEIIIGIDKYMRLYARMMQPIDELRLNMLKNFAIESEVI